MRTVAWHLNLNAEMELADPQAVTSTRMQELIRQQGKVFLAHANEHGSGEWWHALVSEDADAGADVVGDALVQAWCPTPQALAAIRAAGRKPPVAPSLEVLQRVNHRAFAAGFGQLPGTGFVRSMAELESHLHTHEALDGWLLKRAYGFAGRWRKQVRRLDSPADRRWVEASMEMYGRGLMVEPWARVEAEYSWHGWIGPGGRWALRGEPTRLFSDADGAWMSNRAEEDLTDSERDLFHGTLGRVQAALIEAGYFGPFGIDAFRWRDAGGERRFQPASDVNARYTMGYFVGMAKQQDELFHLLRESFR